MFFILPIIFTALAAFFSLNSSIVLIAFFFIFKKLLFGGLFLTCGLPTLAGAATFWAISKSNNRIAFALQFLLPLACMILFISNPASSAAFLYSFFWLIPVLLFLTKNNNIFFAALSSTFVAHAVGSVMWLYATNMPAEQWLALVPVVAFERLVAALGITFFYKITKYFIGLYSKRCVHSES